MTPFGHLATGLAAGGVLSPALHRAFRIPFHTLTLLFLIASLIPDIDAVSLLWDTGIYFGREWYSHHIFAHSLLGAAVMSMILALGYPLPAATPQVIRNPFRKNMKLSGERLHRLAGVWLASFLGCLVHFAGDIIAPPGPWKGIALFWPSSESVGGLSRIYWHNWYIIYISTLYIGAFLSLQFLAGMLEVRRQNYPHRSALVVRTISFAVSLLFIVNLFQFIGEHDYGKMGFRRWEALNRSLVSPGFMEFVDRHRSRFTIFWRKRLFSRKRLMNIWIETRDGVQSGG